MKSRRAGMGNPGYDKYALKECRIEECNDGIVYVFCCVCGC